MNAHAQHNGSAPPCCEGCNKCAMLLAELSNGDLGLLHQWLQNCNTIGYEKGDKIVQMNLPAFGVYLICKGRVKVVQTHDTHKEHIIKIVGPGEMFGEECVLGDKVYTYYAEALDQVKGKFIKQEELAELFERFPALTRRITQKLAMEVKALQQKLLELSFNSCKDKVARLMLAMGQAYGTRNGESRLQLDLPRADLAKMAGVSVETLIRTLAHFERRGWIEVRYHTITFLDEAALGAFAPPLAVQPLENIM